MLKKKTSVNSRNLVTLFFDGGSRGNPGVAAGAAVIIMPDGEKLIASQFLPFATNNEAEYTGLLVGLQKALQLDLKEIAIQGDSKLVVNQINGLWKVKNERLYLLWEQASQMLKQFDYFTINWLPREQNQLADRAVNDCIDTAKSTSTKSIPQKDNSSVKIKDQDAVVSSIYEVGAPIFISKSDAPGSQTQGIIIDSPQLLANGKWLISIEIDHSH